MLDPASPRDALLLVNLGTPAAPTARAVRRYLAEFLHDHRVVQLTRWLWCPLLHFLILPLRGPRVARKYAEIWMDGGSPLAVHTRMLAAAVAQRMPGVRVAHAMRYGEPALDVVLRGLAAEGAQRVLVLPLYPQYSTTTTASVSDVIARFTARPPVGAAMAAMEDRGHGRSRSSPDRTVPEWVQMVDQYATDPGWVAAVVDSIRAHWEAHGRGEMLLFSFHGIPQRLVDAGDPYERQCRASVAAIVAALDLAEDEYVLAFQSRFGREQWLQPATDATLRRLAADGMRCVDVVCPGFAVDCLETLEEIAMQNAELFAAAVPSFEKGGQGRFAPSAPHAADANPPQSPFLKGGGQTVSPPPALRYIPCLNDAPAHADALAALARRAFETWRDADAHRP